MKIWRKLNYVFMWAAIILAAIGMGLAIYQHRSWNWQFSTGIWAFIAYLNQKSLDKYDETINKVIDKYKN